MTHTTTESTWLYGVCPCIQPAYWDLFQDELNSRTAADRCWDQGPTYQYQGPISHFHYKMTEFLRQHTAFGTASSLSTEITQGRLARMEYPNTNSGCQNAAELDQSRRIHSCRQEVSSPQNTRQPLSRAGSVSKRQGCWESPKASWKPWLPTQTLLGTIVYLMSSGLPELLPRPVDMLTQTSYGSPVVASKSIWSLSRNAQDHCEGWDMCLRLQRESVKQFAACQVGKARIPSARGLNTVPAK